MYDTTHGFYDATHTRVACMLHTLHRLFCLAHMVYDSLLRQVGMACVTDGDNYCFRPFFEALESMDNILFPVLNADPFGDKEVCLHNNSWVMLGTASTILIQVFCFVAPEILLFTGIAPAKLRSPAKRTCCCPLLFICVFLSACLSVGLLVPLQ